MLGISFTDAGSATYSSHRAIQRLAPMIWFHRTLWLCLLEFVTYVAGMSGGNLDWSDYFRQSIGRTGLVMLMFLPLVYWEAFCRFTVPEKKRLVHLFSSSGRWLFIFVPATGLFARLIFQNLRRLSFMESFAVGHAIGCLCVVLVDFAISRTLRRRQLEAPADH